MSKQIVTLIWCDGEDHDPDNPVKADDTHTVSINGAKPKELDLCDTCRKAVLEPLLTLIGEAGQPTETVSTGKRRGRPPKEGSPRAQCPLCDYSAGKRGTIVDHVRAEHDQDLSLIETERGTNVFGEPLTLKCPECGRGYSRGQGLAAHARAAHGHLVEPVRI